jgi:TolB protein
MSTSRRALTALLCALVVAPQLQAQWANRYPKVAGMSHHVYLEGYELPILTNGPMDVATSPDGKRLAFASRGWLWLFDVASGKATRITKTSGVDSRPAWSPDGSRIAFVRDNGQMLSIAMLDTRSGAESVVVRDSAIVLDPAFSVDGATLFYSSAVAGDLDLWRMELATHQATRITTTLGANELQPMPTPDGTALIFIAKTRGGSDQVRRITLATGESIQLAAGSILSMMRGALSPDGRTLALTWPSQEGYELRTIGTRKAGESVELLRDPRLVPLAPSFSRDGRMIWYSHADAQQRMHLARIASDGGVAEDVVVKSWDWGAPTATLRVVTRLASGASPVGARLALTTADGHPLAPDSGQVRFDGQNGVAFFYSTGVATVTVPAGDVTVNAVQGLATPVASQRVHVNGGETRSVTLTMAPVWNARANGWLSGEHHFHLNYGGPYHLEPSTLIAMGQAEDMDVLTPMLANLSHRFEDQPLFSYRRTNAKPWIVWSQEVRAHFFGHVGLINTNGLFWPWIWGPGYDVHTRDDRTNAEPLAFGRAHGGVTTYVHPVEDANPFASAATLRGIPLGFVPDAVQGNVDAIELACLWSDERGTAELWYRVLNAGVPMAINAGTDVMNNLYRTMAIGTTRVYVHPERPSDPSSYFAALKAGHSFVTTGPLLEFRVGAAGPGDVVARGGGSLKFSLDVHSAVPIDSVQIVINGAVVAQLPAFAAPGSTHYTGNITLPSGGWVAARVSGPATRAWPGMSSYAYAHTSPVWIDRIGSTEPAARVAAARDLLRALDVADQALETGYTDAEHPKLLAHYAAARRILEAWAGMADR